MVWTPELSSMVQHFYPKQLFDPKCLTLYLNDGQWRKRGSVLQLILNNTCLISQVLALYLQSHTVFSFSANSQFYDGHVNEGVQIYPCMCPLYICPYRSLVFDDHKSRLSIFLVNLSFGEILGFVFFQVTLFKTNVNPLEIF